MIIIFHLDSFVQQALKGSLAEHGLESYLVGDDFDGENTFSILDDLAPKLLVIDEDFWRIHPELSGFVKKSKAKTLYLTQERSSDDFEETYQKPIEVRKLCQRLAHLVA